MTRVEADVNRPYVPPEGTTVTATVDVEPGEQAEPVERHIGLCIDTSGSMTGEKIRRAREGVRWVFGLLEPEDYVTVVGFDSDAELIVRPIKWADIDREIADEHVSELTAGGGTNTFAGLERTRDALDALKSRQETGEKTPVRRILVLSDGKDKHHDPADFEDLAIDIDEAEIRVEAAGIGEDYNEETIRTLGETARGEWAHLEGPGDIESFFGEAVERAGTVVAPDARLEIDAAEGVEVADVYRALPQAQAADIDWTGNRGTVKLPDLTEREHQRVVMKIHVPPRSAAAGEVTVADLRLSARGEGARERITVEYTDDGAKLAQHNGDVQLSHQRTVVQTELGRGNVGAAETKLEQMTHIHGEDAAAVQEIERQTELVAEGGRAERNRATKILEEGPRVEK